MRNLFEDSYSGKDTNGSVNTQMVGIPVTMVGTTVCLVERNTWRSLVDQMEQLFKSYLTTWISVRLTSWMNDNPQSISKLMRGLITTTLRLIVAIRVLRSRLNVINPAELDRDQGKPISSAYDFDPDNAMRIMSLCVLLSNEIWLQSVRNAPFIYLIGMEKSKGANAELTLVVLWVSRSFTRAPLPKWTSSLLMNILLLF